MTKTAATSGTAYTTYAYTISGRFMKKNPKRQIKQCLELKNNKEKR